MVDIRQMRYFVALAETLHFGRAAERLHISQPPLSRQIASLERELGVRLVERSSRTVSLTFAGRRFLDDARAVVEDFDQACRNARLAEAGERGELAVGFMMHAAYTVVPGLARRFTTAHPGIRLHLQEVIPGDLIESVRAARFDAGIMFDPGAVPGLERRRIYRDRLCLAVPAGHRLAGLELAHPADMAGEPFIMTPDAVAPPLSSAIRDYLRSAGVEPVIRLEAQLQQTILSLVGEGLGIALVPEALRKLGNGDLRFITLDEAPIIDHAMIWRPGNLNPALKALIELLGGVP